jgi:aldose 1-epimerase
MERGRARPVGAAALLALLGTTSLSAQEAAMTRRPWGRTAAGESIELFTLESRSGLEVEITNLGGIVVSLKAKDRRGRFDDVVLGFESLEPYQKRHPFFGCIAGRYGNRIGGARFEIDGKTFPLPRNDGENTLHGGVSGFDKKVWTAREAGTKEAPALELRYSSPDGEEGFPGRLEVKVTYSLTADDGLRIDYEATTDKPTVVNLTNHSYFNLAGPGGGDILSHVVFLDADRFTAVRAGLIPTGELRSVAGTPFDFRTPTAIGARIDAAGDQLELAGGYDHNFVLNGKAGELRLVARVREPVTGRVLEVLTTEPGVQFYTGNFLDGSVTGKKGTVYERRSGFCLETQHFPDSPNQPSFPSTVLRPGQTYKTTTIFRFTTSG